MRSSGFLRAGFLQHDGVLSKGNMETQAAYRVHAKYRRNGVGMACDTYKSHSE